jgi:radical SAM superfamily enzyme YgiQ (UPF0313 family)
MPELSPIQRKDPFSCSAPGLRGEGLLHHRSHQGWPGRRSRYGRAQGLSKGIFSSMAAPVAMMRMRSFALLLKSLRGEISLETVRGLSYLKNGELTRTEDSPFIEDLDSLPFPARDLLPLHLYGSRIEGRPTTTMMTSRGCPFTCNFCSSSRLFGHRWRARSVESIFEEMEMLHEKPVSHLSVTWLPYFRVKQPIDSRC